MADLVDRQVLLDHLKRQAVMFDDEYFWVERGIVNICTDIVRKMPTIEPKRGECDTCRWHNACNWETLMKECDIEHGYCAAYSGAI